MDGHFTFPIAKLEEVVNFVRADVLSSENFPFSETDITHPKAEVIQQVQLKVLEFIYNMDTEILFKAAQNEHSELGIIGGPIRPVLVLFSFLQKLMPRCMVNDFGVNDLLNPTSKRTLRCFSGIMNYSLFRKDAFVDFMRLKESWNESLDSFSKLKKGNEELQARLNKKKSIFINTDREIQSAAKETSAEQDLENELAKQANQSRDEVSLLKSTLKEKNRFLDQLQAEFATKKDAAISLRAKIVENPKKMIADIQHKNMNVQNFKVHLEEKVQRDKEFKEQVKALKIFQDYLNVALEILEEISNFVEQGKRRNKELGEVESELQRNDGLLRNLTQKQELTRQTIDQQQDYFTTFLIISQTKKKEYAEEIQVCNREMEHQQLQVKEKLIKLQVGEHSTTDIIAAEEQHLNMELQQYETMSFNLTNHVENLYAKMDQSVDVFKHKWDALVEELSFLEKQINE